MTATDDIPPAAASPAAAPPAASETGYDDSRVNEIIGRYRELRPLLRANAAAGEAQRSPVPDVDKPLRELGAYWLTLPPRWGGGGMSNTAYARAQMELAKGDPSVAWVVQIINSTTWIASLGSDALQEALFGDGPVAICGSYNPPGKARKVDGGYIVSGRWPYSSGSRQATWAQCGFVLPHEEGGPVTPGINFVYIPMDQLTIEDTWYVVGLQGTGSDTTVADEVFVPDHLVVLTDAPFGLPVPGKRHAGDVSDRQPLVATIRATGMALLVGAAQAMLELLEADVVRKPLVTTLFATKAESQVVDYEIGKVAAQLDTAEKLLLDATAQIDGRAVSGQEWTLVELARHKAQCAQVTDLVHDSIERIMYLAGSSAFLHANPLSRFWRDIHVGLRHVQYVPNLGYEIYGRDRLGISPNLAPPFTY
jgi:alkylation response protein AidB-like acyl-CoA dehydrogenase